jgi:uncharacterized cupredoxin-like copper-binding protein
MVRLLQKVAVAFIVLASCTAPVLAAENQTKVKVALLDMTGLMPSGATGYGMMGPGMMGPGMMGQGQRGQYPGMMGPGMMGYGMMGGMMSIRVDQSTVMAGAVTLDVTNWSRSVLHEMLVIAVDNPNAPLLYDYYQARVPEDQVKVLGEVADLEPNASKTLKLTLTPGSYLLICNVPGHYAAGMVAALSVTQ